MSDRRSQTDHWAVRLLGGALAVGGIAVLSYVVSCLHAGRLDTRPRHSTAPPSFLYASSEPVWFYGILLVLTALGAFITLVGARMLRSR